MKQLNKQMVNMLAKECMFELSEQESDNIVAEFDVLIKQLDLLNKIDTSHVDIMVYPFEVPVSFMREDTGHHVLSQDEALKNAPKQKDGFVVIPKVVKE